jgi:hypothetical protein
MWMRLCADGDQQRVVPQATAATGEHGAVLAVDLAQGVAQEQRAVVGRDHRRVVRRRARPPEGGGHRIRSYRELAARRDQRDVDALPGEAVQGDERLQAGDASARDDDAVAGRDAVLIALVGAHCRDRPSPSHAVTTSVVMPSCTPSPLLICRAAHRLDERVPSHIRGVPPPGCGRTATRSRRTTDDASGSPA